jgi:hypothetical protein
MKEQLLMKVLEMLLNSNSENAEGNTQPESKKTLEQMHVGKYVLIRTYSAGVHFGRLIRREGKEVLIDEARRIWSWDGAFTLSKISIDGVGSGKLSTKTNGFIATETIEILPLSEKAKLNLYGLKDHE